MSKEIDYDQVLFDDEYAYELEDEDQYGNIVITASKVVTVPKDKFEDWKKDKRDVPF